MITQAVEIVAWVALGLVGLMLARLGHFYESRAGRPTRYRVLAAGAVGLMLGGVWEVLAGDGAGRGLSAVLLAVSGTVMGLSARYLFGMMLDGAN